MFSYGQYCPVAKSAEILGDRWTLMIVREMTNGVTRFNEFHRGLPGISRSVLVERLRRLEGSGIVERRDAEYLLTDSGRALQRILSEMGHWAARWVLSDPTPKESDPDFILLGISRHVNAAAAPAEPTVLEFELHGGRRRRRYWVVIESGDVSLCLKPPAFDTDLVIRCDARTLYRVYSGWMDYRAAIRSGAIELDGPRALVRAFPELMEWSAFAETVRQTRKGSLRPGRRREPPKRA